MDWDSLRYRSQSRRVRHSRDPPIREPVRGGLIWHRISSGSATAVAGAGRGAVAVIVTVSLVEGVDWVAVGGAVDIWAGSADPRAGAAIVAAESKTIVRIRIATTPAGPP